MRIRDLISRLTSAGFILMRTHGDHRVFQYRVDGNLIAAATVPGARNEDAPPYLISQVRDAITDAGGTWDEN